MYSINYLSVYAYKHEYTTYQKNILQQYSIKSNLKTVVHPYHISKNIHYISYYSYTYPSQQEG